MEQEYPVPGFEGYTISESGIVYSYKSGHKKQLNSVFKKAGLKSRKHSTVTLYRRDDTGRVVRKHYSIPRLQLEVKLGRPLKSWEQARHINENHNDHHRNNLKVGCCLLNTIDDIENGTRETSAEYIDEAIERLLSFKVRNF